MTANKNCTSVNIFYFTESAENGQKVKICLNFVRNSHLDMKICCYLLNFREEICRYQTYVPVLFKDFNAQNIQIE